MEEGLTGERPSMSSALIRLAAAGLRGERTPAEDRVSPEGGSEGAGVGGGGVGRLPLISSDLNTCSRLHKLPVSPLISSRWRGSADVIDMQNQGDGSGRQVARSIRRPDCWRSFDARRLLIFKVVQCRHLMGKLMRGNR